MRTASSDEPVMFPPCDESRIVPELRWTLMLPPSLVRSAPARSLVTVISSARTIARTERGTRTMKSSAQNVAGNDKLYWCVLSPHGTARSGPFVNHSHYAQFMNLSLGAALALVLVHVHRVFAGRRVTPAAVAEYLGSPEARVLWGLGAMMVLGMATIFASLSRGGVVSLMMAAAFTALVISRAGAARPGWAAAKGAGAFDPRLVHRFRCGLRLAQHVAELHQAQGAAGKSSRTAA
jgi:hypothetical protein